MYNTRRLTLRLASGFSALALGAALTGCGVGTLNTTSGPVEGTLQISGKVHGGEQPVKGSNIQVFSAGTTGYGTGATSIMTATVTTDANGFFLLTGKYNCPSSTALVYITATGGDPGVGSTNSAIKLASAIGTCATLQAASYVWINEVTTAATAFSLAQYYGAASGGFGAPNTTQAQLGLANAIATVGNLVGSTNGVAVTSVTKTGAGSTLTIVPETAKLNTIANIIAACVNSKNDSSSPCQTTLFPDVTPTGGTAPTDTLGAAVMLNLNPTSTNSNGSSANLTALYGLQTATSPFVGVSTQPTDWTLGVQYQDNAGTFLLKPQNIAVDGYGNVWVLSNASGLGGLVQISNSGTPLSNISTLSEYGPFVSPVANPPVLSSPKTTTTTITTQSTVFTTTFGAASNNPSVNPRNLAIDPSNNVWFTQSSGTSSSTGGSNGTTAIPVSGAVFEVATTAGVPNGTTFGFSTGKSSYGLSIDATGNVFVGQQSSSAYFSFYEFPYSSTAGNGLLVPTAFLPYSTTAVPAYSALDKTGNLFFTNAVSTATTAFEVSGASASSCAGTANTLCQPATSSYTFSTLNLPSGVTQPYGLAEGSTGIWIANGNAGNSLNLVPFGTSTPTAYGDANHFSAPKFPAADGTGNVWVANNPPSGNTFVGGSVSALTSAGAFLSPSNGGSTTVPPGFTHAGLNYGLGTAVDPSGNVWVANNGTYTAACTSTTFNTCTSVFEIVGAASPVVTPIAAHQTTGPVRP